MLNIVKEHRLECAYVPRSETKADLITDPTRYPFEDVRRVIASLKVVRIGKRTALGEHHETRRVPGMQQVPQ